MPGKPTASLHQLSASSAPTLVVFQLMRSAFTEISPTLTPLGTTTNTAPATTQAKSSKKAAVRRVSRGCRRASDRGISVR
jgi:hypothetical protein